MSFDFVVDLYDIESSVEKSIILQNYVNVSWVLHFAKKNR